MRSFAALRMTRGVNNQKMIYEICSRNQDVRLNAAKPDKETVYNPGGNLYKPDMTHTTPPIKWINLTFFIVSPIVAILGVIWRLQTTGVPWQTWALAVVMAYATGFGITAGYHRLFSHKSYEAAWPVRLALLLFGGAAFQASALWWSSEHRYHHRFVDSDDDPYGINKGFWYAHIGWLVARREQELGLTNVKDLQKDPLVAWQHRYFYPLALVMSFGFPAVFALLWNDPWGGFMVAGVARLVLVQHFTWCINSVAHTFGRQTYSDRHSSRDSGLMAFFTYGEGYHNFHHEFPSDYRNGIRWYQWDPTKWLIHALAWCGLSRNLRRINREKILAARLQMDRKRAAAQLAGHPTALQAATERLDTAMTQIQATYQRFLALKAEYALARKQRLASLSDRIQELRQEMRIARRDFRIALAQWRTLIRGPHTLLSS